MDNEDVGENVRPPEAVLVVQLVLDAQPMEIEFGGCILIRGMVGGMHHLKISDNVLTIDVVPNELK